MENTPLSPKAQAVLSVYEKVWGQGYVPPVALVALRTAADQLDHATSAHTLYAIADELEAL